MGGPWDAVPTKFGSPPPWTLPSSPRSTSLATLAPSSEVGYEGIRGGSRSVTHPSSLLPLSANYEGGWEGEKAEMCGTAGLLSSCPSLLFLLLPAEQEEREREGQLLPVALLHCCYLLPLCPSSPTPVRLRLHTALPWLPAHLPAEQRRCSKFKLLLLSHVTDSREGV